ncbi:hypothetical protein AB4059_08845 [Lysobacter sp. 2RAF19]
MVLLDACVPPPRMEESTPQKTSGCPSAGPVTLVRGGKIERDNEAEALVAGIWDDIVAHIKDVLKGDAHGYEKYLELADPSIEEIISSISKIDELMNKMLDGFFPGDLPIEVELQLIDCQQCIHLIRRVHIALKHANQPEYDDIMHKLRCHSGSHHDHE